MFYKNSVLIISKQNITKTHSMQSLLSCRHTTCVITLKKGLAALLRFSRWELCLFPAAGLLFVWKPVLKKRFCKQQNTRKHRHWRRSGVFTVNFEHILYIFLVVLWLTLNKYMLAASLVTF